MQYKIETLLKRIEELSKGEKYVYFGNIRLITNTLKEGIIKIREFEKTETILDAELGLEIVGAVVDPMQKSGINQVIKDSIIEELTADQIYLDLIEVPSNDNPDKALTLLRRGEVVIAISDLNNIRLVPESFLLMITKQSIQKNAVQMPIENWRVIRMRHRNKMLELDDLSDFFNTLLS